MSFAKWHLRVQVKSQKHLVVQDGYKAGLKGLDTVQDHRDEKMIQNFWIKKKLWIKDKKTGGATKLQSSRFISKNNSVIKQQLCK